MGIKQWILWINKLVFTIELIISWFWVFFHKEFLFLKIFRQLFSDPVNPFVL